LNWKRQAIYAVVSACLISPLAAPQLLAFPYSARFGAHRVYSQTPIGPQIRTIVENADRLAARSPIALPNATQPIFLTDGGWRWNLLALASRSAFAFSRTPLETIVVNRSDPLNDEAFRPAEVGGTRSLTGTLAHEMTHSAIRAHFGPFADFRYPAWLREGYCDYVAGGGSITDDEAKVLMKEHPDHSALVYWRGRKQIESELERNGKSIEAVFKNHGT
jgi:hypothetical protein